jgi:trehalose/maltose hydrolase-like predicted phosphorylase
LALFFDEYDSDVIAKNFAYYEPRTEHGSSLSACAYSIAAARIHETDAAYRYFMKTATIDITGDSKQYVGDLYIGGTHPAANGGAWLACVKGLCGVSVDGARLMVNPALPANWKTVKLTVKIRGRAVKLDVSPDSVRFSTESQGEPIELRVGAQARWLEAPGEAVLGL